MVATHMEQFRRATPYSHRAIRVKLLRQNVNNILRRLLAALAIELGHLRAG